MNKSTLNSLVPAQKQSVVPQNDPLRELKDYLISKNYTVAQWKRVRIVLYLAFKAALSQMESDGDPV